MIHCLVNRRINMKKIILCTVIIGLLTTVSVASQCYALLWPCNVGNEYTYDVTDSIDSTWEMHMLVSGTASINANGNEYCAMDMIGYEQFDSPTINLLRSTDNEVYAYDGFGNEHLAFIDGLVGTKWTFQGVHCDTKERELEAIESVIVPAGKIDGCLEFANRCLSDNPPTLYTREWIKPDFGLVKEIDYYGGENPPRVKELASCNGGDVPSSATNLMIPGNAATGVSLTPQLDWTDVPDAALYNVQICSSADCSVVERSSNQIDSGWTVAPALNPNTAYWWHVRAKGICEFGPWSSIWSFTTVTANGDPLDNWHNRTPANSGYFFDIAYGNSTFVAVGGSGLVLTSTDGITWTKRNAGTNNLQGVTYGNGTFVAVGLSGKILTSSDNGAHWTPRASNITTPLDGVTYGNGTFVAVGWGGKILTSSDNGAHWTVRSSGTIFVNFYNVAYGNGTFVVVGWDSFGGKIFTSSNNGQSWTSIALGSTKQLQGVTYGNGTFVAVGWGGTIITSSNNGVNWTSRSSGTTNDIKAASFGNNTFVAVGLGGTVRTSDDGFNWRIRNLTVAGLEGVTYGNGTFVVVGQSIILQSDPLY
jgi:hypothetical protein